MAVVERIIKTTFKLRRGKASTWAINNPILADGEPGFEIDTYKLKIGDGYTPYNDLPYIGRDGKDGEEGESIIISGNSVIVTANNKVEIFGFADAKSGQIPSKSEDGKIFWIDPDVPLTEEEILSIIK